MRILFVAFVLSVCVRAALPWGYTLPTIDLAGEKDRQIIVDREPGQYLGHPTTALLEDGKTIVAVYPKGHGKGPIVMKRSHDGGWTWSERLPVPESWSTSKETPTIHRVVNAAGINRLILWSGLYPARLASCELRERGEEQWTELKPVGDWGGIVVMSCLEPLKTDEGHYLAMFHDDGRYFSAEPRQAKPPVFTLYKTFSRDGGLTWSRPEAIFARSDVQLCEPGPIRSPDGKQLAVLLRENSRRLNSHVIFSNDEGATWSEPRELPAALTGDRHVGRYTPDGRLFISFRDTTRESPTKGDWVAWVGKYEDIVAGREGQYRVRLMDNTKDVDCAYPGVEVLSNGAIVATTYGHWEQGEEPYIVSVRLTMDELDARAAITAPEDDASKAARERAENAARQLTYFPMNQLLFDRWEADRGATPETIASVNLMHDYVERERVTNPAALAPLLRHPTGYVRALAIAALFHREEAHLCPFLVACMEDPKLLPGSDPQTVGYLAARLLACYVNGHPYESATLTRQQFIRYWEIHHQRSHCAGWTRFRFHRAIGGPRGSSEALGDRSARTHQVLAQLDDIPPIDRALTLWYLTRWETSDFLFEERLITAFRALLPGQVIALLRGERLSDDPDLIPTDIGFKTWDSATNTLPDWLYSRVTKVLPKSAAAQLAAEYDRAVQAGEDQQVGPFALEKLLVAASMLDPEGFTELLKKKMTGGSSAIAALWQARGMQEAETILKWLFDPELGNSVGSNHSEAHPVPTWGAEFLDEVRAYGRSDTRELLRAVLTHPKFPLLHQTALQQLRMINEQLETGKVTRTGEHNRADDPGGDPELPKTVAEWRNELREGFNLPLEEVPDLPKSWTTIRGATQRFRIPQYTYLVIDGSTDTFAHPLDPNDAEGINIQVRSLSTGGDLFTLNRPQLRHAILPGTSCLGGGLFVFGRVEPLGIAVADLNTKSIRVIKAMPLEEFEYFDRALIDPDGASLLLQRLDELALFRVADGVRMWSRRSRCDGEFLLLFDHGKRVATAPDRKLIYILDASNGAETARLDAHSGDLSAILASTDGQRLVTYGFDGRINIWDAAGVKLVRTIFTFVPREPRAPVALSADGSRLAIAPARSDSVLVYDLENASLMGEVRLDPPGYFEMIALTADGARLAAITNEQGWLNVWDLTALTKR